MGNEFFKKPGFVESFKGSCSMTITTAELYRQKESSSLTQTAKFIFSRLLENCQVLELGDLLKDIKTGKTPSKNEKKYYEDEFIDWFKPNEIGDKKYLEKAESKLSKFAYDKGQVTIYKANSILINAIGDVGRIAILNHEASSNQQITGIELNEEKLLTEYCYYYLLANRHHFYKDLFQTTLSIVNQKKIKQIPIPVPNLEEQKRIVLFLNQLEDINSIDELKEIIGFDDLIGVAEKFYILKNKNSDISTELTHQLDLVKQLRQAFLREAMQGKLVPQDPNDEPASVLLEKIKAEKERLIKEKKIKKQKPLPTITEEEIPFEIPENWVWCRLGTICEKIGSGSTPKGSNYSEKGFPFFRSQNVQDNGLVYNDIKYISEKVQNKMNGTVVLPKDILLNITGGSLGRCALVPNDFSEGNVSQHVCIVRPILCENSFIHKLVLSPLIQQYIFGSTTGAGREGLPKYNLEQFAIPLPPLSEQHRIVAKLDELMQYCDDLEASIKDSQLQNELLLQQVLREALEPKEKEVEKV